MVSSSYGCLILGLALVHSIPVSAFPTISATSFWNSSNITNSPDQYTTKIRQYEVIFDFFEPPNFYVSSGEVFLYGATRDLDRMRTAQHALYLDPVKDGSYNYKDPHLKLQFGLVQLVEEKKLRYEHVYVALIGAGRMIRDVKQKRKVLGSQIDVISGDGDRDTPVFGYFRALVPDIVHVEASDNGTEVQTS